MPVYTKLTPQSQQEVTKRIKDELRRQGASLSGPADLKQSFKDDYLRQGLSEPEAELKSKIAARGR
jgi:hypothetical protein